MDKEINALTFRETCELILAPTDAVIIGCRWVFTLKYRPDGSVHRYKASSWPKVILKHMTSTILKNSRQLPE